MVVYKYINLNSLISSSELLINILLRIFLLWIPSSLSISMDVCKPDTHSTARRHLIWLQIDVHLISGSGS